ncbi:MAG TPA: alpha-ribazole kinase [Desulfosporosinus sp.]|nr:alpha-ribazole kinase [Desulfosporosinus sp.]
MGYLGRDVEVVSINPEQYLVGSCDSCGAIGMKDLDAYKISGIITGRLTTRVTLMEVLSTGAAVKMMTVAISNEPHPTADRILEGVKEELDSAGLSELPMAISTEKNMITQQTGLGISVVGVVEKNQLRIGTAQPGDDIFCLGLPKVGPEITNPDDPEIVQINHIQSLLGISEVFDIIPVGSRGIRREAELLAAGVNTRLHIEPTCSLDLDKSAGPSSCLIFSVRSSFQSEISEGVLNQVLTKSPRLPLTKVGNLFKI